MSDEKHVVVVDDEPDIRETLREYLELQGFRVTCADGGASLRRVVAEEDVDDVLGAGQPVQAVNVLGQHPRALVALLRFREHRMRPVERSAAACLLYLVNILPSDAGVSPEHLPGEGVFDT